MKISELTEKYVILITNEKEAKGIAELLSGLKSFTTKDIEFAISSSVSQYGNNACINTNRGEHLTYGSKPFYKQERYKVIPASKFLKPSTPSKKDLQEALSKVGEELSSMNERLCKLEAKSEPKTANGIEIHFDEVTEGLPEKWKIKITEENRPTLDKWYKENRCSENLPLGFMLQNNFFIYTGEGQSEHTEITFETFKKYVLKEEVKEAVELETGKWYKDEYSKALVRLSDCNGLDYLGYGFDRDGEWMEECAMDFDGLIPATEQEVFEALKAEAEKRGFKGNITFKRLHDLVEVKGKTSFSYYPNGLGVYGDNMSLENTFVLLYDDNDIFCNGQWATIISQPEAIDFSKAGQLVKHYNSDMLVLTTGKQHRGMFSGVKVYDPYNLSYIGEYSDVWETKMWTSTNSSITLKNE